MIKRSGKIKKEWIEEIPLKSGMWKRVKCVEFDDNPNGKTGTIKRTYLSKETAGRRKRRLLVEENRKLKKKLKETEKNAKGTSKSKKA